jgi:hypothetical protein
MSDYRNHEYLPRVFFLMNFNANSEEIRPMGKLHNVLTPGELGKLDKAKKAELQKKLTEHISNDPMLREIVKRHEIIRKHLKEKLKT